MNRYSFLFSLVAVVASAVPFSGEASSVWYDSGNGQPMVTRPQERRPPPPQMPEQPGYDGYSVYPGDGGGHGGHGGGYGAPDGRQQAACTPDQAVRLATRYGLSDAKLASEGTRTMFIDGYDYNADKSVRLVISKSPGCPLVDRL